MEKPDKVIAYELKHDFVISFLAWLIVKLGIDKLTILKGKHPTDSTGPK